MRIVDSLTDLYIANSWFASPAITSLISLFTLQKKNARDDKQFSHKLEYEGGEVMAKDKWRRISRGGVWHILVSHPFFQVKVHMAWFPCFLAQLHNYSTRPCWI